MSVLIHKNISSESQFFDSSDEIIENLILGEANEDNQKIQLILPTGRLQRKYDNRFVRLFWEKHKMPASDPEIYTFDSLVKLLLNNYFSDEHFHFINELYKFGLFDQSRIEEKLFFAGDNSKPPLHAIQKIYKLIEGLKKDGITPDNFLSEILGEDKKSTNSEKLNSLGKLFQKYQNKFSGNLIDSPLAIGKLIEYFKNNSENNKTILPCLYFDFFFEFNKPEIELLSSLAGFGYPILIKLDYSEGSKPLPSFTNISSSIASFLENGFEIKFLDSHSKSKVLSLIQNRLFSTSQTGSIPEYQRCLRVVESESKTHEIKSITKLIKHLHFDKNIPLEQIIIHARSTSEYSLLMKEEFAKARIPVNISDRFEMASSPIALSIFNILELILSGFRGDLLLKFASNLHITFPENLNIEISLLKKYLYEFRLVNKTFFAEDDRNETQKINELFDIKIKNSKHKNEKNNIFKVRENILSIFNLIESETKNIDLEAMTPDQFRDLIVRFIQKFSLTTPAEINKQSKDKFSRYLINREIEKNSKGIAAFTKLINELSFVLENTLSEKKQTLSYYFERLKAAVSGSRYQIRELYDYGITFTSIEQSRGFEKKVSILLGFTDEQFPMPFRTDKIIGKQLYSARRNHTARERNLFYHFLTSGTKYLENLEKEIYVFYPKSSSSGEFSVSPFVEELAHITGLRTEDLIKSDELCPWSKINTFPKSTEKTSNSDWVRYEQTMVDKTNSSESVKLKLEHESQKAKSPYNIEKYVANPYNYFVENMLGLRDEILPDESISGLEKGNIIHKIVERFCVSIIEDDYLELQINSSLNIPLLNLDFNKKEKYSKFLLNIAEEEFEKIEYSHPYFSAQKGSILGTKSHSGLLDVWLNFELAKLKTGNPWRAAFFEFTFDNIEIDEKTKINGRIDRIDLRKNGQEIEFLICDYKLSNKNISTRKEIENLEKFQLTLYILATKIILDKKFNTEFIPVGGIYQFLIPHHDKGKSLLIEPTILLSMDGFSSEVLSQLRNLKTWEKEEFNKILINVSKKIKEINESIESGNFLFNNIKEENNFNKKITLLEKIYRK
jgi:PD-(D/E)XK nuclease superfamily